MMKNYITISVAILLVVLNVILAFFLYRELNENEKINSQYENCRLQNIDDKGLLSDQENYEYNALKYQDYKIDANLGFFNHFSKPTVFIRFFEFGCSECIDSLLNETREYVSIIGAKNIAIVADYNIQRDLYVILKQRHLESLNCFNISNVIPFDKSLTPYIFVANKDGVIKLFFIPDKYNKGRSKRFFELLRTKYFVESASDGQDKSE